MRILRRGRRIGVRRGGVIEDREDDTGEQERMVVQERREGSWEVWEVWDAWRDD